MFGSASSTDFSVSDWYLILSRASLEFEMSSRRKICETDGTSGKIGGIECLGLSFGATFIKVGN